LLSALAPVMSEPAPERVLIAAWVSRALDQQRRDPMVLVRIGAGTHFDHCPRLPKLKEGKKERIERWHEGAFAA
jgi:hypothetical protein